MPRPADVNILVYSRSSSSAGLHGSLSDPDPGTDHPGGRSRGCDPHRPYPRSGPASHSEHARGRSSTGERVGFSPAPGVTHWHGKCLGIVMGGMSHAPFRSRRLDSMRSMRCRRRRQKRKGVLLRAPERALLRMCAESRRNLRRGSGSLDRAATRGRSRSRGALRVDSPRSVLPCPGGRRCNSSKSVGTWNRARERCRGAGFQPAGFAARLGPSAPASGQAVSRAPGRPNELRARGGAGFANMLSR
jgi:hypothetical protein